MVTRARPATAAVLGGLVALAGTGCSQTGRASVPLDRATGAVLADAADRLADALAADESCRALDEADALRERARRALAEGDAPEPVVAETTRVVDATTAELACDREEGDEEGDEGDEDDDGDQVGDDDGADAEADGGTADDGTPDTTSDDGSGDQPPEPTTDDGSADGGSADDGSADDGGPDERGPDGGGPPGQDKDRGNGGPPEDRGGGRGGGG